MTGIKFSWQQRQPREKVLIFIATGLLLAALLKLAGGWAERYRDDARRQLAQQQQALKLLPDSERRLLLQRKSRLPASSSELNALAQELGLALRVREGDNLWRLESAVTVPFTGLLQWLQHAEQQGLRITQLQVRRDKQDIRLTKLELTHAE